jgi:hypothetical protein
MPIGFGALFTVMALSASVFLEQVEPASSRPALKFKHMVKNTISIYM